MSIRLHIAIGDDTTTIAVPAAPTSTVAEVIQAAVLRAVQAGFLQPTDDNDDQQQQRFVLCGEKKTANNNNFDKKPPVLFFDSDTLQDLSAEDGWNLRLLRRNKPGSAPSATQIPLFNRVCGGSNSGEAKRKTFKIDEFAPMLSAPLDHALHGRATLVSEKLSRMIATGKSSGSFWIVQVVQMNSSARYCVWSRDAGNAHEGFLDTSPRNRDEAVECFTQLVDKLEKTAMENSAAAASESGRSTNAIRNGGGAAGTTTTTTTPAPSSHASFRDLFPRDPNLHRYIGVHPSASTDLRLQLPPGTTVLPAWSIQYRTPDSRIREVILQLLVLPRCQNSNSPHLAIFQGTSLSRSGEIFGPAGDVQLCAQARRRFIERLATHSQQAAARQTAHLEAVEEREHALDDGRLLLYDQQVDPSCPNAREYEVMRDLGFRSLDQVGNNVRYVQLLCQTSWTSGGSSSDAVRYLIWISERSELLPFEDDFFGARAAFDKLVKETLLDGKAS